MLRRKKKYVEESILPTIDVLGRLERVVERLENLSNKIETVVENEQSAEK